jgi:hypothetical protein
MAGPVNSQDALALAIEKVNALANNARGYADGVTLTQKIDAVERLAAFLHRGEAIDVAIEGGELVVDFTNYWPNDEVISQCLLCGALVEDSAGPHADWHRGLGR